MIKLLYQFKLSCSPLMGFPGGSVGKESACSAGDCLQYRRPAFDLLGQEAPLEKEMATHSNILASEIPWTKEPGGLQCMGCKELDMTEYNILLLSFTLKWSCSVASDSLRPHGLWPTRILSPWDFLGKNIGVGCHLLLQGSFLTQGSNLGLPYGRQMLYSLSYQGSVFHLR